MTVVSAFICRGSILLHEISMYVELLSDRCHLIIFHLSSLYHITFLQAFLEIYNSSNGTEFDEESARNYIAALEKGRENEKKLNDNYMRKKHGQLVEFGGIIQLYHVKSGKYLTGLPGTHYTHYTPYTPYTLYTNYTHYTHYIHYTHYTH